MRNLLKRLYKEEEGATMVEYGLMVGLIAVVAIVAVTALGTNVATIFDDIKDRIADISPLGE